jgi:hypothetical protein
MRWRNSSKIAKEQERNIYREKIRKDAKLGHRGFLYLGSEICNGKGWALGVG